MKKNYTLTQKAFFVFLLGFAAINLNAQVSTYTFSQSSTTYTAISGGTLLGNTTTDDERFVNPAIPLGGTVNTGVGFPIGFNFTYNGTVFDRLAINANGWISLGQSALTPSVDINSTNNFNGALSSTYANNPALLRNRIVAIQRDLNGQAGASLRLQTIGTTPNQVCVIQWTGYRRYNETGDNLNFQIRLYETTNVIEVHFSTVTFGAAVHTGTAAPQIGLSGTVSSDFNSRVTTTNWNATTAGATNNLGCEVNAGVIYPVSGTVFAWAPLPLCLGTPVGGTTVADINPVCDGEIFTLSLNGATGGTGITYQWLTSNDGINFVDVGGATSPTLSATQAAETYERCIVTCISSGLSDTSVVLHVTMKPANLCYCTSAAALNFDTKIDSVEFLSVLTGSAAATCETYTDYTGQIANTQQTVPFSLRIRNGSCSGLHYAAYVGVYIDYNQNGDLSDAGELAYSFGPTSALNTIPIGNISIPFSASLGQTGMRIVFSEGALSGPCDAYDYGETEDYLLNITAAPACTDPPVAGTISGTTAVCPDNTVALTLSGHSVGTSLQWETSTDNSSWSEIAGETNVSYNTPPITDTVYYRVKVKCADSVYTASFEITLNPFLNCYCVSGILGFCGPGNAEINNVNIPATAFNNNSGCNVTPGGEAYTAFPDTGVATATLQKTVPYTFNVGCSDAAIVSVWIDYNQNGIFEVSEWTQITTNATNGTGTVTIPMSALLGQTGMRVRSRLTGNPNAATDACLLFGSGECEDYIITIAAAPACITPAIGGVATGPSTGTPGPNYLYIVTGSTGAIQWQYSVTSVSGPFIDVLGASDDSLIVNFNGPATFWIRAYLTSPGCDPDSSNAVETVVTFTGDSVCQAIPLSFGVNGPYNTTFATVQTGEPAPPASLTSCSESGTWCNSTITNTLWFTFVAPASGRVSIQSPDFDTQLALWDANTCGDILIGGATLLAANDDDSTAAAHGGVLYSSFLDTVTCLIPGRTYYVQLDAYTSPGGITTVVLTDLGGATAPLSVSLNNSTDVTCWGDGDGAIEMDVTGGTGNYTYEWNDGQLTEDLLALSGGMYILTVTDLGCNSTVASSAIVVAEPDAISPTLDSLVDVKCFGESTGGIYVTITGGTAPYTYAWSNGATTEDLVGVPADFYSGTITDDHGCEFISPFVPVSEPSAPLAVTLDSVFDNVCAGGSVGAIYITVDGGTPGYAYDWSDGNSFEDNTGLIADVYDVSVTDINGCTVSLVSVTVGDGTPVSVTIDQVTDNACAGLTTGAIDITASGGNGGFTFDWNNGDVTEDISGLAAGIYDVDVEDMNGCTASSSATVNDAATVNITIVSVTDNLCGGGSAGAIEITVSGGTANYTYNWSNGDLTEDITGLSAGPYDILVQDAVGCTATESATVGDGAIVAVTVDSVTNNLCAGGTTGAVYITVSGGLPAYSFDWSNNATTEDITGLAAGMYDIVAADANGCSGANTAQVLDGATVTATLDSSSNVTCHGLSDGSVSISVSGGAPAYVFDWSNNATTEDISGLGAGGYSVDVMDDNGCTATLGPVTIIDPAAVAITLDSVHNVKCFSASTGAAYTTASGGTAPLSILWDNNATTDDISGLVAGSYVATVKDDNGCTATATAVITAPSAALSATSVSTNQIQGGTLGSVNVTIGGGTSPYTSLWNNSATTEDLSSLVAGVYCGTITDANGCSTTICDTVDFVTGIGNVEAAFGVNLYPNPTQDKIFLELALSEANDVTVDVYTISGQLVHQFAEKNILTSTFEINFSNEAVGVYYAKIKVGETTLTRRIVVTR